MQVAVHESIDDIPAADWNSLRLGGCPFLQHAFLNAAEKTDCVTAQSGWIPRHLSIRDQDGLRAAMPLYEKSHSWGEFVFDWAWANAYEQAGLNYYPKLVSAIPFTPAPGKRFLLRQEDDSEAATALLTASIALAEETDCSSLHILFPDRTDLHVLDEAGLLLRNDCQFHWHNRGYQSFDDFLAEFTSSKRKKARRDRRRVRENGISFRRLDGNQIDSATLARVYQLISGTFERRGSIPYFSEAFFAQIVADMPADILFVVAEQDAAVVAAAVFFESADTLYGRYWGSDGHFDALHFETCYYQGIDYCIEHNKQVFEPGTQGEHKISRGFSAVSTHSAHWLAHPEFSNAIEKYLQQEGRHVGRYMDAVDSHSPYKTNTNTDGNTT